MATRLMSHKINIAMNGMLVLFSFHNASVNLTIWMIDGEDVFTINAFCFIDKSRRCAHISIAFKIKIVPSSTE